jgi:hypothetical protein
MSISIGSRRLTVTIIALVGTVGLIAMRLWLSPGPITLTEAGILTGIPGSYYAADTIVKSARAKAGLNPETGEKTL